MITIFTALYPEAKELIRALSLKKDMTQNHFQVFSDENNQIQIVITGASAIAAATAVAECSTRREPDSGDFLINYGSCAGRKNIPVGTVSLCNKLTQTVDGRTYVLSRYFIPASVWGSRTIQFSYGTGSEIFPTVSE